MKKVAVVCPRIPYPIDSGESIKAFHTFKALSEQYDVTLFCTGPFSQKEGLLKELPDLKIELYQVSKLQILMNLVRAVLRLKPLQRFYFYSGKVKRAISESNFDFNYLYTIRSWEMRNERLDSVLDMTDSIAFHYEQASHKTKSFLWKCIYAYENLFLFREETHCIERSRITFLVNRDEVQRFQKWLDTHNSKARVEWTQIGLKEELFNYQRSSSAPQRLFFFGKMNYQPNELAVRYFVESILPQLPANITFEIFGSHPSAYIQSLPQLDGRIVVHGFLDDPYAEMIKCGALVAPMQTGGGVQNKILEAMALGVPVVTTTLAAKGLAGLSPDSDFKVCDQAEDWARVLNELIVKHESYIRAADSTREKIKALYGWQKYRSSLLEKVKSALAKG